MDPLCAATHDHKFVVYMVTTDIQIFNSPQFNTQHITSPEMNTATCRCPQLTHKMSLLVLQCCAIDGGILGASRKSGGNVGMSC